MNSITADMISAAKEVYDEAMAWVDYPYTSEQMIEAMLRNALRHYEEPQQPEPAPMNRTQVDKSGFVYFVSDGEAIKIGKAKDPRSRLANMQVATSKPLRLLGVMPGGRRAERAAHKILEPHRVRGEWFSDCPEVREYMAENAKRTH